jgi:hypothetical protein
MWWTMAVWLRLMSTLPGLCQLSHTILHKLLGEVQETGPGRWGSTPKDTQQCKVREPGPRHLSLAQPTLKHSSGLLRACHGPSLPHRSHFSRLDVAARVFLHKLSDCRCLPLSPVGSWRRTQCLVIRGVLPVDTALPTHVVLTKDQCTALPEANGTPDQW